MTTEPTEGELKEVIRYANEQTGATVATTVPALYAIREAATQQANWTADSWYMHALTRFQALRVFPRAPIDEAEREATTGPRAICPTRHEGYNCTRAPAHVGDHVAGIWGGAIFLRWPQSSPPPAPKAAPDAVERAQTERLDATRLAREMFDSHYGHALDWDASPYQDNWRKVALDFLARYQRKPDLTIQLPGRVDKVSMTISVGDPLVAADALLRFLNGLTGHQTSRWLSIDEQRELEKLRRGLQDALGRGR